jgi:hypothetical protein
MNHALEASACLRARMIALDCLECPETPQKRPTRKSLWK